MKNLRQYRKLNNLTQVDLAELIKVKQATISKLELGLSMPSMEMAYKIERATDGAVTMQMWMTSPDHAA